MFDLMGQVDNYCERIDFSFLSEPLNFFSNGFFLLAALIALISIRKSPVAESRTLWVMCLLLFLVGIGSGCFHSFATHWGEICDVGFIGLFVFWFLWQWMRLILEFSLKEAIGGFGGFLVLTVFFQIVFRGLPVYGSQGYFGVAVFLWVLGWHQYKKLSGSKTLLYAGLLFFLSLILRTLDQPLCELYPMGTHAFWHSLNAGLCFLTIKAMREELERKASSCHEDT